MAIVATAVAVIIGVEAGGSEPRSAPTTVPPATPEAIFQAAAESLQVAGGFTYRFSGRWEMDALETGETELITENGTGTVSLPGAAEHSVTSSNGSRRDVIVVDGQTWLRSSAFPDQIEQRPWADFDLGSVEGLDAFDPTALPEWLQAATDHRDGGEDAEGHTVVRALVPPSVMSPEALDLGMSDERTLTSELELTVDEAHVPVRVAVSATTQSAVVELEFDGIDTATQTAVEPPAAELLDATPGLNEEDIAVIQGPESLGLAGVPEGWFLGSGFVTPDAADPNCAEVELMYVGLGGQFDQQSGPEDFIFLAMTPMACDPTFVGGDDPNFSAGDHEGVATETPEGNFGALQVGETIVGFGSSLSLTDLEIVLATLGTVDLAAEPEEISGIPSEAT